jgi:5-(carboxyamino)imidazole ribonucleotide synthase
MSASIRVGVLGGGQLGRMLALAGYPLGIRLKHIGSPHDTAAGEVAEQITAEYSDREALARFAQGASVITYEWENVPIDAVRYLEKTLPVYPSPAALEVSQDRIPEKQFFQRLRIPTAPFASIDNEHDLKAALGSIRLPAVIKTRRLGYDGKGQALVRTAAEANEAWQSLGREKLIMEGFVNFDRELSVIAARSTSGEVRTYPLIENHHARGILRLSVAPAPAITAQLQEQAESIAKRVLNELKYVGIVAIELFQRGDDLLANEMAPRVHNSGHWTIEGAETSQFENHLRAITGLPLGSTRAVGCSAMLNLIGDLPPTERILSYDNAHLHLYGKHPRSGRKVGHITVRAANADAVKARIAELKRALKIDW